MGTIVTEVVSAVKAAIANSKTPAAPTASAYWTSLHASMLQYFPCDNAASAPCAENVRNSQEAMRPGLRERLAGSGAGREYCDPITSMVGSDSLSARRYPRQAALWGSIP